MKGSAREIDPCLVEELKQIENTFPRFKEKFKSIMSCCGHGKYQKTFVVQNKGSKYYFDWFSGIGLTTTKRADSRKPFYKRDKEGYYFIPEIENNFNGKELELFLLWSSHFPFMDLNPSLNLKRKVINLIRNKQDNIS